VLTRAAHLAEDLKQTALADALLIVLGIDVDRLTP